MTDKGQVIGSIFRGALSGGAWVRILHWVKSEPGRSLTLNLTYTAEGEASWLLTLDGESFESSTFEGVTMKAVVKLGPLGR